jgi:1-acyl-sn-glycerol-3-phosphate acyltransferase
MTGSTLIPSVPETTFPAMLRTIVAAVSLYLLTMVLSPIVVVAHALRIDAKNKRLQFSLMRIWARWMCYVAGVKVVVHGTPTPGTVYISNHVSYFDVFALCSVLPRTTFVAKDELRRVPVFGWGAEGAGVVFLARENRKSAFDAYADVAKKVADGLSVVVYPEGTRGATYSLRPFKKGPFVLAIAAGAPVVPVVVYGAKEIMRKGSWAIRPGTVHVHLLEPVPTAGFDYGHRHEVMRTAWQRMADLLQNEYGAASSYGVTERSA